MTEPVLVIPLTSTDLALYEAFRVAEMAADMSRPKIEEMAAGLERERDALGNSMRAAYTAYAEPFDPATMRRYVVIGYVLDLLERVAAHKADVAPILYPEMVRPQPTRRRA